MKNNHITRIISRAVLICLSAVMLTACENDKNEKGVLNVEGDTITLPADAGSHKVPVSSNIAWRIEYESQNWFKTDILGSKPSRDYFTLDFGTNTQDNIRTAEIRVFTEDGASSKTLQVIQLSRWPFITPATKRVVAMHGANDYTVDVTTNIPESGVDIDVSHTWITDAMLNNGVLSFSTLENSGEKIRTGKITLSYKDANDREASANIEIRQATDNVLTLGETVYLVDSEGNVAELNKAKGSDYEYEIRGDLGSGISFRIAEKLTPDDKIDYSGYVWANPDADQLELVDDDTSSPIVINAEEDKFISRITFDLLMFAYSYTIWEDNAIYVNDEKLSESTYTGYKSALVEMKQNEEVYFYGFENIKKQITPEFFEYVSPTSAKFLGLDGTYKLYLDETNGYIFIDLENPAAGGSIWMMWNATGFPNYGYHSEYRSASGFGWNWNAPNRAIFFRKVSEDVFSGTIYCNSYMSGYFLTAAYGSTVLPPYADGVGPRLLLEKDGWRITTNQPDPQPLIIEMDIDGQRGRFRHRGTTNLGQYRWRVTVTMSTKTVHFERLEESTSSTADAVNASSMEDIKVDW